MKVTLFEAKQFKRSCMLTHIERRLSFLYNMYCHSQRTHYKNKRDISFLNSFLVTDYHRLHYTKTMGKIKLCQSNVIMLSSDKSELVHTKHIC